MRRTNSGAEVMMKIDVRVGESLAIGEGIILTLEKKSGQLARLSVRADPGMKVRLMPSLPGIPVKT